MIKIFIIDSHPVYRLGLGSILEGNQEFKVIGNAANVQDALTRMDELQPDVVVLDFPGSGNGAEEAVALLQEKCQAKVIVLTDSDRGADFFRAIKAGAKGYLMKSVEFSELIDSIRLVASGSAIVYSASVAKLLSKSRETSDHKENRNGDTLSAREREVLELVARGASNKEIASHCYVSPTTVKAHLRRILEKLEVKNRAQAVAIAIERGYLTNSRDDSVDSSQQN